MHKDAKILVVDDNEEILVAIEMLLSNYFGAIKTTKNPNLIPSIIGKELFDVIILDMNYSAGISSGNEGIYWMNEVLKIDPEAIVVLITAYGDFELAVKAIREGGTDFIQKPWVNLRKMVYFIDGISSFDRLDNHKHSFIGRLLKFLL